MPTSSMTDEHILPEIYSKNIVTIYHNNMCHMVSHLHYMIKKLFDIKINPRRRLNLSFSL